MHAHLAVVSAYIFNQVASPVACGLLSLLVWWSGLWKVMQQERLEAQRTSYRAWEILVVGECSAFRVAWRPPLLHALLMPPNQVCSQGHVQS